MFEELLQKERLAFVDVALAKTLLPIGGSLPERLLLAFLSVISRSGHLCLRIQNGRLHPNPDELLELPLTATLFEGIAQLNQREELFGPGGPLRREEGHLYFQKYWQHEQTIARHLAAILQDRPSPELDLEALDEEVASMVREGTLLSEQGLAITQAASGCLSVITGGPGTGKTYTAGHLIRLFLSQRPLQVAMAAPTGKAVANLQASLHRALKGTAFPHPLAAATLHSLLEAHKEVRSMVSADLILVDECSMMDSKIAAQLLASRKPGSRLILLGDRDQLPPVEAGSFFSDLVSGLLPTGAMVPFHRCLRAELGAIVNLAEAIKEGNAARLWDCMSPHHRPFPQDANGCTQALWERVQHHYPTDFNPLNPKELLERFNRFRILSALRRGPFGVDALNQRLLRLAQAHGGRQVPIPIIVVKNDTRLGLYNGEVGVLKGREAFFPSQQEPDGVRRLPALLLPKFEYAYCLSVHKSQGSEFDHVLLLLPPGSEIFGREVLYTAVTRAKKGIELWADAPVLEATLQRRCERVSGLPLLIKSHMR